MDLKKAFEYAVVLFPAILCVLFVIVPPMKRAFVALYSDLEAVNLAKEMIAHGTFYGPAVIVFFGFDKNRLAGVMALAWFVVLTLLAYALAVRAKILKKELMS